MQKLKEYYLIILILLIFIGSAFYWYEWRPAKIRKECSWTYSEEYGGYWKRQLKYYGSNINPSYSHCLTAHGLK